MAILYLIICLSLASVSLTYPVSQSQAEWQMAYSPSAATVATAIDTDHIDPPYLDELAKTHGKLYFGTATDRPGAQEDTDTAYQSILNDIRIFGQITPANGMKGAHTEPYLGVFDYSKGQATVSIAQSQGKMLRCHNLIWAFDQPEWLTDSSYHWTRDTLLPVMERHIKTLITRWADVCHAWDVVNEAYTSDGTLGANPWRDVIGDDYVHLAFQYAHEAVVSSGKPIRLYYNDYGIESPGNKIDAVHQLINDLAAQGIQISIGLESHFVVLDSNTFANQVAVMQGLQNLGVTFAITELDVRFPALPPDQTYGYAAQALRYYETVSACMAFSLCEGITVWDFDDAYSWVPSALPGEGGAHLYDAYLTRKPAYYAVADALQGKPCSVCGQYNFE